jgi:hypothetical protein
VLSGRGLCDGLITRPEESYRLWRVVCVISKNLVGEDAIARFGLQRHVKNKNVWDNLVNESYIISNEIHLVVGI